MSGDVRLVDEKGLPISFAASVTDTSLPVLIIGGDHAYIQWYGTNGRNGMAQMYRDQGITPYLAINTQDDAGEYVGGTNRMTWAQVRAVAALGVEITSHGSQHIQEWTLINTGLKITYSGAGSAATVSIAGTWPAITISSAVTGGPGSETWSFDTSLIANNTLAKIKANIEAVGGGVWTCRISPELTGSENAANIITRVGTTSVKTTAGLIAVGGGITIQYTGTVYKTAYANVTTGNILELYGDGVRVSSTSLSGVTLTSLIATVNGVTGFVAALMDNNKAVAGTNQSYITGIENAVRLWPVSGVDLMAGPRQFEMGLTVPYMINRQIQESIDTAAANGVTINNFCQSGGGFLPAYQDGAQNVRSCRGDANVRLSLYPRITRGNERPDYFYYHSSISLTHTIAEMQNWIDALCDSPGCYSTWLIHQIAADGSSGYSLGTSYGTNSITEADFYTLIRYIKTKVQAGLLRVATPDQARSLIKSLATPRNRIANPRFLNSGATLTGNASLNGVDMGGWGLQTPAGITACSISSGVATITSDGSSGLVDVFRQQLIFEPGKTYEFSCDMEMPSYTSGNGVQLRIIRGTTNAFNLMQPHTSNTVFTSYKYLNTGRMFMTFTIPTRDRFGNAYVRSTTKGPWDLSAAGNVAMQINLFAKGAIDNINVQGAAPATTHAEEIATKLNTAVAAAAAYRELQEYWSLWFAEDGYLCCRAPWRGQDQQFNVRMDAATTNGGATAVVMGNATVRGPTFHAQYPYPDDFYLTASIAVDAICTVKVSKPFIREVQWS